MLGGLEPQVGGGGLEQVGRAHLDGRRRRPLGGDGQRPVGAVGHHQAVAGHRRGQRRRQRRRHRRRSPCAGRRDLPRRGTEGPPPSGAGPTGTSTPAGPSPGAWPPEPPAPLPPVPPPLPPLPALPPVPLPLPPPVTGAEPPVPPLPPRPPVVPPVPREPPDPPDPLVPPVDGPGDPPGAGWQPTPAVAATASKNVNLAAVNKLLTPESSIGIRASVPFHWIFCESPNGGPPAGASGPATATGQTSHRQQRHQAEGARSEGPAELAPAAGGRGRRWRDHPAGRRAVHAGRRTSTAAPSPVRRPRPRRRRCRRGHRPGHRTRTVRGAGRHRRGAHRHRPSPEWFPVPPQGLRGRPSRPHARARCPA